MKRALPVFAALLLLGLSGLGHGLWTDRWGPSTPLQEAAARCDALPMTLGDWEGKPTDLDPRALARAEAVGSTSRQYTHRLTGQTVSLVLLCGRPGDIGAHTPAICYPGVGYGPVGGEEKYTIPAAEEVPAAELATARFSKPGLPPDTLRLFWAWSDGGAWSAPADARLTFARSAYLYKLYVIRRTVRADEPVTKDPCTDFLRTLLPALQQTLSPT
jgi:hypothetical protein